MKRSIIAATSALALGMAKHIRGLAMPSRTFAVYWLAPHATDSGARLAAVDPDFR